MRVLLIALVVATVTIGSTSAASVMAIDFGSEWMKVTLVKPGVPMEIVLNKDSSRKTPMFIGVNKDELMVGIDAKNFVSQSFRDSSNVMPSRSRDRACRPTPPAVFLPCL